MIYNTGSRGPFELRKMHKVSLSSSCSSHKRKRLSSVKKTTAVLKIAMTEKNDKWKSREWYGTTKTGWRQPAGSGGGQSSLDAWAATRGKRWGTKLPRRLGAREIKREVERSFCRIRSNQCTCEREENDVEQKWQGECEKRS